jgi:mannose-6-phosphate isomerase-like protein (cupin superfamily)
MIKNETWYVQSGKFEFCYIDIENGTREITFLSVGDVVYIERGLPHQLKALRDDSVILEVSTEHFDCDSYRIYRDTPKDLE